MEHLPLNIYLVFGLTVLLTLIIFYKATQKSTSFLYIALAWMLVQFLVSLTGFYTQTKTKVPVLPLLAAPPLLFVMAPFFIKKGTEFIKSLNIKILTILHIVRILVELVLYWLAAYKAVPQLITFEGRNFDIFSGLTAPAIYYFGFVKNKLSKSVILVWNLICLILLFAAVFNTVLFVLDHPNIAIVHFPFILLPSFIIPLVLFSHLVSIRWSLSKTNNLLNSKNDSK